MRRSRSVSEVRLVGAVPGDPPAGGSLDDARLTNSGQYVAWSHERSHDAVSSGEYSSR